jgi:hypothetical protein
LHRLAVIGLLYEYGDDPDAEESCNAFLDYFRISGSVSKLEIPLPLAVVLLIVLG